MFFSMKKHNNILGKNIFSSIEGNLRINNINQKLENTNPKIIDVKRINLFHGKRDERSVTTVFLKFFVTKF